MRKTLIDHIERTTWYLIQDYELTPEEIKELVNRLEVTKGVVDYVTN